MLAQRSMAEPTPPSPALPLFQAEPVATDPPAIYDISLLAPRSWADDAVRRAMLEYAARIAERSHTPCFRLDQTSLERNASFVPLKSGYMTITTSASEREWRRYWRLYQNLLRTPGVHLGLDQQPRIGQAAVQARARIRMCGDPPGKAASVFWVSSILQDGPGEADPRR